MHCFAPEKKHFNNFSSPSKGQILSVQGAKNSLSLVSSKVTKERDEKFRASSLVPCCSSTSSSLTLQLSHQHHRILRQLYRLNAFFFDSL